MNGESSASPAGRGRLIASVSLHPQQMVFKNE